MSIEHKCEDTPDDGSCCIKREDTVLNRWDLYCGPYPTHGCITHCPWCGVLLEQDGSLSKKLEKRLLS